MDWFLIAFNWLSLDAWLAILKVAFGLGMVIFVHELGHFLVAKACGVKCEKFYIGFDVPIRLGPLALPTALARWRWGETEYGIGIIPLGGYVKMLGQDDNPGNADRESQRIKVARQEPPPGGVEEENWELDPRSYPAKTVPQRMAIISAGVIMNLITAVLFAAIAFGVGVSFIPAVIGGTSPGSPAWMAGLQPGDRIVQIGEDGTASNKLRYQDLREAVMLSGTNRDLKMKVVDRHDQERWVSLRPSVTQVGKVAFPSLGVVSTETLQLSKEQPTLDYDPRQPQQSLLQPDDRIVAVDGEPLASAYDLAAILAARPNDTLKLTVERLPPAREGQTPAPQRVDIELAPNPVKTLGMAMAHGPIAAVRPGSPAARAGIREGDWLVSLNGEPVTDPLLLQFQLSPYYGQEISLEVEQRERSGPAERRTVKVVPEAPAEFHDSPNFGDVDSLGLAFRVYNVVESVQPDSPAAQAGIQPKDIVTHIQLLGPDESTPDSADVKPLGDRLVINGENYNWPYAFRTVQDISSEMQVRLTIERSEKEVVVDLVPVATPLNNPDRRLVLSPLKELNEAQSWQEAISLGLRETKESVFKVVGFLQRLLTGEISPTNLGGPGTIAVAATSEASQGTSRLLIFLTLLSANLAVVNFLPIPVLDGGHMLFLTAELLRGKPVEEKWQYRLTMLGLAFVLSLMVFVIGLDVVRFTGL